MLSCLHPSPQTHPEKQREEVGVSAQTCTAEELQAQCQHCPPPCPRSATLHQIVEEWSRGDEQGLKIEHDMAGLLCWCREHWLWERDTMLGRH